ncbi:MAG: Uma2 family endonuclease [Bryobacteraceae bacterium]|nr:Uma2 family endonuclease [Bryobacteraceae bacterium]
MATQTLISVDEYLHTVYEHDCEYVHGEVVERGMPTENHSRTQTHFIEEAFLLRQRGFDVHARAELRNRLEPTLFRIPDVAYYIGRPNKQVPDMPPLAAIEIKSPDDRRSRLLEKLAEYRAWGVKYIWFADPEERKFFVYDGELHEVEEYSIPEIGLRLTREQIFD